MFCWQFGAASRYFAKNPWRSMLMNVAAWLKPRGRQGCCQVSLRFSDLKTARLASANVLQAARSAGRFLRDLNFLVRQQLAILEPGFTTQPWPVAVPLPMWGCIASMRCVTFCKTKFCE